MPNKFYNTIHASGQTLIDFNNQAESQNNIILHIFELNKNSSFTPFEVQKCLIRIGKDYPITSVRRAMTTLTEEGKLIKLSEMKPGNYGKPNYTWKLK